MADAPFAPLTAALVRRAPPPAWLDDELPVELPAVAPDGGWREDLRLFAVTWTAGFLFFLIFLA